MRRNVLLLALGQAIMMSGNVLLFATGALVGQALAADKSLATLPLALQMAASLAVAIPASFLMARIGRRPGFVLGALLALGGALLAAYSIAQAHFLLFCVAAVLIGAFTGIGNYFRFAAVEAASPAFQQRALSYVLAGGVVAAIIGPNLARWAEPLGTGTAFTGGYLALAGLYALAVVLLLGLRMPRPAPFAPGAGRPLAHIVRQPVVAVAMLVGALGYGIMALIMTATPLAMDGHQHGYSNTAWVIEWHVLGMFVPSFFTGHLLQRFGITRVMTTGAVLTATCVLINLLGTSLAHFWTALVLLGIGWNFLFIGATALLTAGYMPAERAKVQAANDVVVFGVSTLAVLSAGALQHRFGWEIVNLGVLPGIGLALVALWWLSRRQDGVSPAAAATGETRS